MDATFQRGRGREHVKSKQLAALKKLGHDNLKLNEYESAPLILTRRLMPYMSSETDYPQER